MIKLTVRMRRVLKYLSVQPNQMARIEDVGWETARAYVKRVSDADQNNYWNAAMDLADTPYATIDYGNRDGTIIELTRAGMDAA